MRDGRLGERVAVVTGAGQGVGRGIALALAAEGASVAVIDVNAESGRAVCAEIEAIGAQSMFVSCDVTVRAEVDSAVAEVVQRWQRLDILVNNAQRAPAAPVSLLDHDDALVDLCFDSGYRGTLYFMQAAYPYLKLRGGRVINLGSAAGLDGMIGYAAYGATKEAIRALSKTAAREWGRDGITVNILCPLARSPGIESFLAEVPEMEKKLTAGHPIARIGDCEKDIGRVAAFLASDDAAYLTGLTVPADGGALMIR